MGKGLFEDASRLPRWAFIVFMVGLVILFFIGPNLPNSGVVQLETVLVQADGFLLAFVSVAFTGMVAEVRSQVDLAIEQRRKLSKQIRLESLRSFFLFILALVSVIAVLTNAIAYPSGFTPEYFAYLFPLTFTILGIYGLIVAMSSFSRME